MATFSNSDYNAAAYRLHRPDYLDVLYHTLMDYHQGDTSQAVDVATGTGQAAIQLAKRFTHVRATDISAPMLSQATVGQGIDYVEEPAEQIGLPDGSVDAVTSAESVHWFDLAAFEAEAQRVLKPQGTLAIWGYSLMACPWHPLVSRACVHFTHVRLGPYWDKGRETLDDLFKHMPLSDNWQQETRCVWDEPRLVQYWLEHGPEATAGAEATTATAPFMPLRSMTLVELAAYLHTWSAYANWKRSPNAHLEADPIDELIQVAQRSLEAAAVAAGKSADEAETTLQVTWTHALILARK
jgi:SAM-dependent methyltransferase